MTSESQRSLQALVAAIRYEAEDVISIDLVPAPNETFPSFEPGAHVDLFLTNGLIRSYSLINAPEDKERYVIAILKTSDSRGGSRHIHEHLHLGNTVRISLPRNNFPLCRDNVASTFVAGGIGITPIYCMVRRLLLRGQSVRLIYCARSRKHAAFANSIQSLAVTYENLEVVWHLDAEQGGPPDLLQLLDADGPDTHYYCCGPSAMLERFIATCASLGYRNTHIERFSAPVSSTSSIDTSFVVELKRTGISLQVQANASILDTLVDAGLRPSFNCKEGICGTCETRVLSGDPDHRDVVLSDEERRRGNTMMICVSRCRGKGPLILDI